MYLDKTQPEEQVDDGPGDQVRNIAFHLAARQIRDRGVLGAVAELGVYKGDQARLINRLFADRPLYLFDTFSGFSDRDLGAESEGNFSSAIVGDFVDTSIELVESKLPYRNQARFFPGFFPETAEGSRKPSPSSASTSISTTRPVPAWTGFMSVLAPAAISSCTTTKIAAI